VDGVGGRGRSGEGGGRTFGVGRGHLCLPFNPQTRPLISKEISQYTVGETVSCVLAMDAAGFDSLQCRLEHARERRDSFGVWLVGWACSHQGEFVRLCDVVVSLPRATGPFAYNDPERFSNTFVKLFNSQQLVQIQKGSRSECIKSPACTILTASY
jgi:hypothetical protein